LWGLTGKNDIFHTNIQINGPKLLSIATIIFSYTGSPGEAE